METTNEQTTKGAASELSAGLGGIRSERTNMFERTAKEQLDAMANHAEAVKAMTRRFDRQCPSCGGFCKKSGCERANALPDDLARLREIEAAARNLIEQKGRHNTEIAYKRLAALLTPNV